MSAIVAWLTSAPQGAIAALTAALAAAVALLVTVITQWVLGRRARTELLTKKLEELYLALNEVSAHGVKRTEEALSLVSATPFTKRKISGGAIDHQGLDLHRKIFMLVRLYFPKLATVHESMFRCNNVLDNLIREAETGPPLSEEQLNRLSIRYRDSVGAMEEELVLNLEILVKESLLPIQYKRSSTSSKARPSST